MNLEQLNLNYLPDEDRLLLKLSLAQGATTITGNQQSERQEIRVFITRRLLKNLWPVIMQALTTQITLDRPEAAFASHDLAGMQYEEDINLIAENGYFDAPYHDYDRLTPLGETPSLIQEIKFHLNPNQPVHLQLFLFNNNQLDLRFPTNILHGFCKLLQDAAANADWGLSLSLPSNDMAQIPSKLLN